MNDAMNAFMNGFFDPGFWNVAGEIGFMYFAFAVLVLTVFVGILVGSKVMEKWF